jgi:dolichol-phosphate mannosyltransferase
MFLRFLRFNLVSLAGIGVQLAFVAALVGLAGVHYLVATAVAVEAAVLHNFFWHERWTWAGRGAVVPGGRAGRVNGARCAAGAGNGRNRWFFRCVAFHAGNGLVSLLGSLAIMPLLVEGLGVQYLIANLVAIAATGLLNFFFSDRVVFRA